ncbi:MAG: hypothetical protein HYY26_04770 [Acidobacteria bacterium]|nr:hypothetical protein [Acidobacteriota bacterium]
MGIPQVLRYRSFTFLTYHENGPVAWRLRFYEKVTGRWVISNVTFDTQFIEDFVRLSPLEFAGYQALLVLAARERRDRTEP